MGAATSSSASPSTPAVAPPSSSSSSSSTPHKSACVIGATLGGVCTAYFLRMAGFNVTVVDARPSPLASSSSSSSSSPLPSLSSHLPSEASVQSESGLVGTMAATSMVRPALARNMMLGGPHFFYSLAVNLFGLDPTNRRVGLWAWLCRTMEKLGGPEDETEAFEKQMLYHGLPNFYAKPAQALYGLASFSRQLTLQMIRELEIATPVQWGQLQVFTDSTNWRLARAQHKFGLAAAENHDGVEIADSPRPFGAEFVSSLSRTALTGSLFSPSDFSMDARVFRDAIIRAAQRAGVAFVFDAPCEAFVLAADQQQQDQQGQQGQQGQGQRRAVGVRTADGRVLAGFDEFVVCEGADALRLSASLLRTEQERATARHNLEAAARREREALLIPLPDAGAGAGAGVAGMGVLRSYFLRRPPGAQSSPLLALLPVFYKVTEVDAPLLAPAPAPEQQGQQQGPQGKALKLGGQGAGSQILGRKKPAAPAPGAPGAGAGGGGGGGAGGADPQWVYENRMSSTSLAGRPPPPASPSPAPSSSSSSSSSSASSASPSSASPSSSAPSPSASAQPAAAAAGAGASAGAAANPPGTGMVAVKYPVLAGSLAGAPPNFHFYEPTPLLVAANLPLPQSEAQAQSQAQVPCAQVRVLAGLDFRRQYAFSSPLVPLDRLHTLLPALPRAAVRQQYQQPGGAGGARASGATASVFECLDAVRRTALDGCPLLGAAAPPALANNVWLNLAHGQGSSALAAGAGHVCASLVAQHAGWARGVDDSPFARQAAAIAAPFAPARFWAPGLLADAQQQQQQQ